MHVSSRVRSTLFVGAFCAAGLSALLAAAPAAAQQAWVVTAPIEEDGVRRVSVRYDDLDLASVAGRERLDRRVRGAIRFVCPAGMGVPHVKEQQLISDCRSFAMDGARPQLERAFAAAERGERFAAAATIELRSR